MLVEVKRTNSARDVREALMALSYALRELDRHAVALCVVVDSRLSPARLQDELERFREIVRPDIGRRVSVAHQGEDGRLDGQLPVDFPGFHQELLEAIQQQRSPTGNRTTRQQVKAVLVERYLEGMRGLTMADLRRQMGASHPTIAAALDELQNLDVIGFERDGPILLTGLTVATLTQLADEHAAARQKVYYRDPTGHARGPIAMADRLIALQGRGPAEKTAIGGVLGGLSFYPSLNITAAPRLDISVFDADLTFVHRLDAGLIKEDRASRSRPALVVHMQRDCRPPDIESQAPTYAARLDCLADLRDIGFQAEAEEFAQHLVRSAESRPK